MWYWLGSLVCLHSLDNYIKLGSLQTSPSRVWDLSAGPRLRHLIFSLCVVEFHVAPLSIRASWTFNLEAQRSKRANLPGLKRVSPQNGRVLFLLHLLGKTSHILPGKARLTQDVCVCVCVGGGEMNGSYLLIEWVSWTHKEGRNCWLPSSEIIYRKGSLFYASQINLPHFFSVIVAIFPQEIILPTLNAYTLSEVPSLNQHKVRDLGLSYSEHHEFGRKKYDPIKSSGSNKVFSWSFWERDPHSLP